MPQEQPPPSLPFDLEPITQEELQKPGAVKLRHLRCCELEAENKNLKAQVEAERDKRERVTQALHESDVKKQVFEEKIAGLGNKDAISQSIWGAIAIDIGLLIDSVRSWHGIEMISLTLIAVLLGVGQYMVNRKK